MPLPLLLLLLVVMRLLFIFVLGRARVVCAAGPVSKTDGNVSASVRPFVRSGVAPSARRDGECAFLSFSITNTEIRRKKERKQPPSFKH